MKWGAQDSGQHRMSSIGGGSSHYYLHCYLYYYFHPCRPHKDHPFFSLQEIHMCFFGGAQTHFNTQIKSACQRNSIAGPGSKTSTSHPPEPSLVSRDAPVSPVALPPRSSTNDPVMAMMKAKKKRQKRALGNEKGTQNWEGGNGGTLPNYSQAHPKRTLHSLSNNKIHVMLSRETRSQTAPAMCVWETCLTKTSCSQFLLRTEQTEMTLKDH